MNNNELRRWMGGVRDDLNHRLERHETKLDNMQEKCVGCAREFGEMSSTVEAQGKAIEEHRKEHRDRTGLAALIGGLVVAALQFIWNLVRNA